MNWKNVSILFGLIFIFIIIIFSGAPSAEEVNESLVNSIEGSGLEEYYQEVDYNIKLLDKLSGGRRYDITLEVMLTEFKDLNNIDKYILLQSATEKMNSYLRCGDASCYIKNLTFYDYKNSYKFHSYYSGSYLTINDQEKVLESEVLKNIATPSLNTSDESIHRYMKHQFNMLTDYGATYNASYHDSLIANMAAENFEITSREADAAYYRIELK
ncbi:hypothetical protein [Alkalicoccobacillus murimartini]|uniref:Uncharacterized protein n=1 Tax=Alkalicoccobacillus murimartini TaxID=171685 RepID=A0ABT9YMR7_9BACI|nr:hypothetical protein [Alkalicoccobacillus murimartini]MDQ0208888.1 hypothetical protein [Alkalicoccobacillus murimartini]